MTEQVTVVMDVIAKMDKAQSGIKSLQRELQSLKLPKNLENGFKDSFSNLETIFAKYKSQLESGFTTKNDVTAFAKTGRALDNELSRLSKHLTELTGQPIDFKVNSSKIIQAEKDLQNLLNKKNELTKNVLELKVGGKTDSVQSLLKELYSTAGNTGAGKAANAALTELSTGNIDAALKKLRELEAAYGKLRSDSKKNALFGAENTNAATTIQNIIKAVESLGSQFSATEGKIRTAKTTLDSVRGEQLSAVTNKTIELARGFETNRDSINQANVALQDYARSSQSMTQQLGDLKTSTQYFFSLRNMFNLLKRGIREAVDTVKELDAAMTETAVVTKFSVSDMWVKLPEYTANANALGATVQDMYEATTLYYQQGLNAQQAMSIASETMKMARIGGLEAAEATDMMTAALRGFNMELNETSAQRINDVYSNLAAKTASNTEELGNAMQRTASIAANAGMSFEGTAAFLAQAIETTREPAENIGTAMKTIIARMQEMKKNPLEISEVEGEEVDYNKIDAALKSVGISIKKANGDFRDNDAVLLDISKHWDSLSQTQQRYIATTIAGSRQQSRFIAMVGDYERTQELMGYANDSGGASNEQFGKTLDSLEAKINKFQNAWKQFLMGIMNDAWTKRLVSAGTTVLNVVNKIINALSFNGKAGLMKSALSIFTGFTALKFAAKGVNSLIGGLGGMLDPQSSFSKGFFGGASGLKQQANAAQAAAIYKPIVEALRTQTQQLITKDANIGKSTTGTLGNQNALSYKDFVKAQTDFRNLFDQKGGFTIKEATGKLSKMSTTQQGLVLSNAPGLTSRISRGLDNYLGTLKLDKEAYDAGVIAKNNILKGMAEGKIPASEIDKVLNPVKFGKVVGGKLGQNIARQGAASAREYLASQEEAIVAETERRLQAAREGDTEWTPITDKERQRTKNQVKKEMANEYLAGYYRKAGEPNKYEKLQQKISNLGSTVTNTGQAFTSFGIILSNLGLSGVGMAFTTLGTTISSFGMMISSLGPALTAIQAKLAGAATFFEAVKLAAIDAGIASTLAWVGIAAGFAGILIGVKAICSKIEKTAKENAEKVKENYSSAIDEITKKESTLADSKDRLNELAKGVDAQGNNLSLTNDQYQEYLQLSRDVADVAPELIQGYNAQGNAIIATGDAIDTLIEKQQKLRRDAVETYTSLSAITDVIKGIKVSDAYDEAVFRRFEDKQLLEKQRGDILTSFSKADLKSEDISKLIRNSFDREINFQNLTTSDIQWISEHYNDISNLIKEKNVNLSDEAKAGITEAFSNFHVDFTDFETELAPLQDQLQQFLSLEGLDLIGLGLGQEFSTAFNEGLQTIAIDAVLTGDYDNVKNNALEFARGFQEIAGEGTKYKEVLNEVQQAEEEYFDNIEDADALEKYQNSLKNSAQELEDFANTQLEAGVITQQFYNILISSANQIRQSASEPIVTLGEAINTLADELDTAKKAYDNFSEATKDRDYSTAADSMSKIFEEALDEKHSDGLGDNTFWTGSRAILDDKTLNSGIKNVRTIMKENQKMFAEGKEGFDAFRQRILNLSSDEKQELTDLGVTWDETTGMFEKIPEQAFSRFAEILHLNDEAFAALLSKAQQWGSLDFSNMEMMRAALSQDTRALQGASGSYYMNEQDLTQEIRTAHPDWNDDKVAEQLASWKKDGLISLPSKETLSKDKNARKELISSLKDLNIRNQSDLVKALGETGSYTKEDLETYAKEAFGEEQFNQTQFNEDWKTTSEKLTNPLSEGNAILKGIASDVSLIAGKESKNRIKKGEATEKDFNSIDKIYNDIFGGEGPDTPYQYFGQGKNVEGNPLTLKEYDDTRKNILDTQKVLQGTLKDLEKGRVAAAKEYGKGSEEENEYIKRINKVNTALGSLDTYLLNGATYLGPTGTANIDSSQFQQLMNTGWQEALYNLPIDVISSLDFPNLIQELYSASLMNNQEFEQQTPEFKQHIQSLFDQMGIDAQEAYEQGLISWNPELLSSTSAKTREAAQKQAQDNAIKLAEGTAETAEESNNDSTVQANLREAAQKTAQDNAVALAKETGQESSEGFISEAGKELDTFDEKDAAFMLPAAQAFNKKVQDSYLKAYEKAAGEGTTVKDLNITPKVPQPTITQESPKESKVSPTIEQGASIVQQVAFEVTGQEEAQGAIDTIKDTADEGADLTVKAESDPSLIRAESKLDKIKGMAASGVTIKANASGIENIENQNPEINFSSNAKTIKPQVDTLKKAVNSVPTFKTVTISVRKTGVSSITVDGHTWSITTAARGLNNKINTFPLPTFGSLAKGTKLPYGQIGPKGKGGLTLTGEKGYEVAWLPNENRSMILGARGPQMVDLPNNAVVWDHEQSKKIIKQKAIPAGSQSNPPNSVKATWDPAIIGTKSNSSTTINRTNTSGTDKYVKNTSKKVEKAAEESAKSIKRVSVWWENIARQTEATQRKMDKNAKSFEDYLKKTNITLKSAGSTGKGNDYIKNIGKYIGYNQAQVDRANKELAQLASGKWQSGKKKGKAATSKKTKKKKKNQIAYEQGADNIAQISYKKGKKEKTSYINLAKFIKKDSTGAYVVSQKELNAVKGSDKRKAIADAANKEIDDRLSKKYKAEDAIEKAREALDKMGQDLYDTFFGWKNELTEIWRITQKIEQAEARAAQSKEYKSLLDAQLESGQKTAEEISAQRIKAYQNEIKQETELLLEKASSIKEKKQAVVDAYSLDDEVKTLNAVTAKLNKSKTAQKNITNAEKEVKNSKAQVSLLRNKLTNLLQYRNVKTVSTTKNGMEHGMMHKERVGTDKQIAQTAKELASAEKRLSAANKNLTNAKKANESTILNETARTGYEAYAKQLISDIKTQQLASKYTKLSQNADGTYNIDFNAEQLKTDKENAKITTTEYDKIKEYIEHIKETNDDLVETYKDITSGLADMQSRVTTLNQEWANYAEQLWDISEKEESERIDELKTLSSSINDALKKLLDQIKKKLDERRKQEDNAKTERDISQKQQRLAMLQADTSGGHQVEIAQLQQEIADAQQNYQRSLEDQLLDKLQQQADEAAEQRERMIELEEQIKDATNNAALVDYWMGILSNPNSTADEIASVKQAIYDTYMKINKADEKPQPLVKKLEEEVNVLLDGLLHNREEKKEVENAISTLTKGENAPLTLIENSINAIGAFLEKNLPEFTPNTDIKEETDKAIGKANDATKKTGSSGSKKTTTNNTKQKQEYQSKIKAAQKNKKIGGKEFAEVQKKANAAGIHARTYMADLAKTSGLTWEQVIRAAEAKPNKFNKYRIVLSFNSDSFIKGYEKVHGKGSYKKDLKIAKDKKYKPYEYATGGLANYTGPAWLDGTPSKPELVLNAQDTKNFIALKDVLSKALGSTNSVENTYGNATYEININVDHLNNDYDVDKVVERVKKKIVQDSSYRNVTQVRNFR